MKLKQPQTITQKVNLYLFITVPIVSIFAIISIIYFDRPIAEYFYFLNNPNFNNHVEIIKHHHTFTHSVSYTVCLEKYNKNTVEGLVAIIGSHATSLCYLLILPVFLFYFYQIIKKRKSYFLNFLSLFFSALVFAFFTKNALKYFFGRTSPLTDHDHVLSFIVDPPSYFFHFFDIEGSGASFPSGHMFIFSAIMTSIILYYKKLTSPVIILTILLFFGLLFYDLHYLSDLVVGTYLGTSLALGLAIIQKIKLNQTINHGI